MNFPKIDCNNILTEKNMLANLFYSARDDFTKAELLTSFVVSPKVFKPEQ